MSPREDPELEDRLRRMSLDPERDAPASLYRYMSELPRASERRVGGVPVSRVRPMRGSFGFRMAGAALGLVAVLLIVFAGTGLILGTKGPRPAATWQPRTDVGQGQWTGLEWHDITATAGGLAPQNVWASFAGGTEVVRWSGGYAMIGGDFNVWLSSDGLTWKRSSAPARVPSIVAIGQELIVSGFSTPSSKEGIWSTQDGTTWTPVPAPAGLSGAFGLVAGDPGVLAVQPVAAVQPAPSDVYFTRDFKIWTHAAPPSDMAAAGNLQVAPFLQGFVAIGEVEDPNGSETITDDAGRSTRYSYRAWITHDGLTWSRYDPSVPGTGMTSNVPSWGEMQQGTLGAGDGSIYSTDGGETWQADHTLAQTTPGARQLASDGNRIVMSAGSGARFYLGEGDGHWTQLQEGGDIADLPAGGQLGLLTNGVLWIAGNHIYFGQALSGVEPRGSLGPPTTASPGPESSGPSVGPVETKATLPVSSPSARLSPTEFTTTGAALGWTGFAAADRGPAMAMLDGGGVSQVLAWRRGWVATGSTCMFGQTTPSGGLWTSPDGQKWTPASSIRAAIVVVAVAPAGLVALGWDAVTDPMPGVPESVWTSSDGVTWHDLGAPNLAGSLVSIAGTDAGLVATVDVPATSTAKGSYDTYAIEYSTDGLDWTPETVSPGLSAAQAGYGLPPHVQSHDGRFYLMGTAGPQTSSTGFVLTSSELSDEMWFSADGRTWTESKGGYEFLADVISFGRDGMILHTNADAVPGGIGEAYSNDGGMTWHDDSYGPLGELPCDGACGLGPDGVIASNGDVLVALKTGGSQAWLSYDGHTWTPTVLGGGDPIKASYGGDGFVVMPRGVLVDDLYSPAR